MGAVKKRILAILACVAVLTGLCGCASILDGETLSVTAHEPATTATDSIITASTFEELKSNALDFIQNHYETALIHVDSYDGDISKIQQDVTLLCTEIVADVPLGAYAVKKMTGTVRKIGSYHEVEFHIIYKNVTKEQIDAIIPVPTLHYYKSALQNALVNYAPSTTMLIKNIPLTSDEALDYVKQIYYENPMDIVMLPVTTAEFFPDHGADRIIEFTFGYRYEESILKVMKKSLLTSVQHIAESVSGSNDGAILLSLCQRLMEIVTYDSSTASGGEYNTQNISATAYGALVTGSAVGEGYAMAYKAMCDELGIGCYVVVGTRDGSPHAWNIVALDGHYYHIDVSMCDLNGISTAFLKNDNEMKNNYKWDTGKYKVCDGPLTYSKLSKG